MKSQIQSLQSVFFLLLVILGVNAFTRPSQDRAYEYDLTEGKIQAAQHNVTDVNNAGFLHAQQDYAKMNIDFDVLASQTENNNEALPQLSMLSQTIYVYEQEMKSVKFETLNSSQKRALIERLGAIKKEFYKALSVINSESRNY